MTNKMSIKSTNVVKNPAAFGGARTNGRNLQWET